MGTILTLDSDIRTISRQVLDDFITELGKKVKLVYEARRHQCPNCLINPATTRSSGLYKAGGPTPFERGQPCPVCAEAGWVVDAAQEEIVQAGVAYNPREWFIVVQPGVGMPAGLFQIKFFATDWGKVTRAREVVVSPDLAGLDLVRCKLHTTLGDPSNLVPGRYAVGLFERV
jgi:hypothetical protein